jgi:hypothetical protein
VWWTAALHVGARPSTAGQTIRPNPDKLSQWRCTTQNARDHPFGDFAADDGLISYGNSIPDADKVDCSTGSIDLELRGCGVPHEAFPSPRPRPKVSLSWRASALSSSACGTKWADCVREDSWLIAQFKLWRRAQSGGPTCRGVLEGERRPADVIDAAVMVKRPYKSRSDELQLFRFLPHLALISAKEARDLKNRSCLGHGLAKYIPINRTLLRSWGRARALPIQ